MRVASLVPSTTEMVAAMGLGHRLVARTHECDYPGSVKAVPAVTRDLLAPGLTPAEIDVAVAESVHDEHTIYALDGDALAATRPDVVLTQATCAVCAVDANRIDEVVCTMPNQAQVLSFDPVSLEDIVSGAGTLGRAIGAVREGMALESHLRSRLRWLADRTASLHRPRVAALEWPDPIFAPGHWVPDLVEAAGATSVFGAAGQSSVRSNTAAVAASQPDIVLFAFCGYDLQTTIEHATALMRSAEWQTVAQLEPRLLALDGSSYASRPGPRIVDAAEALAWAIHRPHPDLRPDLGVLAELRAGEWRDVAAG